MRARRRTWPHYVRLREALRSYEREALAALLQGSEKWGGVSEGKRRHHGVSEGSGAYGEGAETTQVELEAQRRELEAAGWERLDRLDKLVWRNPRSGYLYPQGAAIVLVRAGNIPSISEVLGGEE
jgi:hypothetical protein